jgi:protein-tyrosine kinase
VQGRKSLAEVAQPTEIPNLFALPCGRSTLGPPALFDSSGIGAALQALRANFDFVLFDLPPTNVYGDTSILAPRLDGALIVIEADRARISEVERVRRNLDRVGVRIVGSILNRKRNYIPAFIEEML